MKPKQFQRIKELFQAALDQEPANREAFLDQACQGDEVLFQEVVSLLSEHEKKDHFLEIPALESEARPLEAGELIGVYRIERELGRGGMGVVYLAEDTRLHRLVALKALTPHIVADPKQKERLRSEARIAASLSHPAIATVYALEESEGNLYIASEYVEGENLRSQLQQGPLPREILLDVAVEVAQGLVAAHAEGVIHRDLKPENIMRNKKGQLKILDFGVAIAPETDLREEPLTEPGTLLGTPSYMAPEQLKGKTVDFRCDIFTFGVLLYELASGSNPFLGETPISTIAKILESEPVPLSQLTHDTPELDQIIERCLPKNPDERYSSTATLLEDLEQVRTDNQGDLRRGRTVDRRSQDSPSSPPTLHSLWWVVHQVLVLVLYGSMVFALWQIREWTSDVWTLLVFFGVLSCAAVNGTLRTHLLFTERFNSRVINSEMAHAAPWLRRVDWFFAVLLLISAFVVAFDHQLLAGFLAGIAMGYVVVFLIVEPATTRALFSPPKGPSE
ncbi:MAG: serine/threonine-protein kinase [Acidobacteria bacterium]|nr:serine/threonine-protein kinase [Acidobacteriota bacterium]